MTATNKFHGRVLAIAGSDSGGGAGIQADIKTITALGGYAASAITAVTVQNTLGVEAIHPIPPDIVAAQIKAVLTDIGADCIKTGMLGNKETIETVCNTIEAYGAEIPLVVDPVMVATSGDRLLEKEAEAILRDRLLPKATLLTPNIPEAEALLNRSIVSLDEMKNAAAALLDDGPQAILLKGGHLQGNTLFDVLADQAGLIVFESERIATRNTHGTGCTLASAIASGLAQGETLKTAVEKARAYLQNAIRTAPDLGQGKGPVNHNI